MFRLDPVDLSTLELVKRVGPIIIASKGSSQHQRRPQEADSRRDDTDH